MAQSTQTGPQAEVPPPPAAPPLSPPPAPSLAPTPVPATAPVPTSAQDLAPDSASAPVSTIVQALVPDSALAPVSTVVQALAPDSAPAPVSTIVQALPPATATAPGVAPTASTPNPLPEHLMYKNRLQEHTQKACIPFPVYQTINEGFPHAPRFRSTVFVDGAQYTSTNTFTHRKAAEQDVAKLALENISKKLKNEGCPLVSEDTVFCKSILNEFAVKTNQEKPIYNTIQPQGLLPVFVSSLVFNGITYTGKPGRTKKEAEQLAAQAVILSLLGTSGSATLLSEIIKSKIKLYAALHKVKDYNYGTQGMGANTGQNSEILVSNVVEAAPVTSHVPTGATPDTTSGLHPPHFYFKMPKPEPSSGTMNLPISFVPPVFGQPLGVSSSSSNKRRKNKKKANKKLRADAELSIAAQPLSQVPSCSVAQ